MANPKNGLNLVPKLLYYQNVAQKSIKKALNMKRRNFLISSILAAPLLTLSNWAIQPLWKNTKKALVVKNGESRFFGKNTTADSNYGRCIISSVDTQNQLYIAGGSKNSNTKKGGPALHIHHQDDEIFYVVSGEFLFQLENEIILGKAGDTIFAPRGLPHTYANPMDNNPGELLTIHQPISPSLEKFYEVFSRIGYMDEKMLQENFEPEILADLMKNNVFVGPPIDVDAALKKLKQ